jgi:hypothetical protein
MSLVEASCEGRGFTLTPKCSPVSSDGVEIKFMGLNVSVWDGATEGEVGRVEPSEPYANPAAQKTLIVRKVEIPRILLIIYPSPLG